MSWRIIYVENASKLSLNLDNLQVVHNLEKYNINLDEISTIVIEDYKSIITSRLLSKLCELGINVIFTSVNKMPVGSLHPYTNNSRTSKVNKQQLRISNVAKNLIWKEIIEKKIKLQAKVLEINKIKDNYLNKYAEEVVPGDLKNKEGQAARIYFKKLFGSEFIRFEEDIINYSLNYTYQTIRSKISQIIIARGLNPSLGIHHKSEYNYFNLSDDTIEVYRPIIDYYVLQAIKESNIKYLTPEFKEKLLNIYNYKICIGEKKMKLKNSIEIYVGHLYNRIVGTDIKIKEFPNFIIE